MKPVYENTWNDLCTWDRTTVAFPPHFHSYLELICVKEGECVVTVDFCDYTMKAGDAVLVFPNRIHSYRSEPRVEVKNLTFMLPPEYFPLYRDTFEKFVPDSPILPGLFEDEEARRLMIEALRVNKSGVPYAAPIAAGSLSVLLGHMLPRLSLCPVPENTPAESRIVAYCSKHYRESLSLSDLSSALHISKFHISHLFSEKLRMSFTDFLRALRVEEACRLLAAGGSVTDAALRSGFGSLRSFNRAFYAIKHTVPRNYAAEKKAQNTTS